MCGITGLISKDKVDYELIKEMVKALEHRGPDETGLYIDHNVGLGQSRLSIMDPHNGKQPTTNEDGNIIVIFNGEIFNYRKLRQQLFEKGHTFKNNSDTAILPHMYEEYGLDMFEKLNGQFAIAIFNKQKQQLILARDRLGEKPLYYYHRNKNFCFGSEVKAILKSGLVNASISPIALKQVFTFWTTQRDRSIFENIFQVPPGSYLVLKKDCIDIIAYWNLNFSQSKGNLELQGQVEDHLKTRSQIYIQPQQQGQPQSQTQAQQQMQPQLEQSPEHLQPIIQAKQQQAPVQKLSQSQQNTPKSYDIDTLTDELEQKLIASVEARMMSDVPIAFYLSGGLDSSLITSIAAQISSKSLNTYSVAFENANFDESAYQHCMSKYLGTNHQSVRFSDKDIPASIKQVITHTEMPLLRSGAFPMHALAKLVSKNDTKVVLSGEGSDELFGGYDIFREVKIREFCNKNPQSDYRASLYKKVNKFVSGLNNQSSNSLSLFYNTPSMQDCFSSHASRWRLGKYSTQFFSPEYQNQMLQYDGIKELEESLPREFKNWTRIQQAQYLEIAIFFSNYLLSSQGDRVSMAGSVECRYPYLDYDIVEFASALPDNMKIRALKEKYIVKKLAKKYLPYEITNRTKFPYRAPINITQLLQDEYIEHMTSSNALKQYGIFDPIPTEKFLSAVSQKQAINERDCMLFMGIVTTQILYDEFIQKLTI